MRRICILPTIKLRPGSKEDTTIAFQAPTVGQTTRLHQPKDLDGITVMMGVTMKVTE